MVASFLGKDIHTGPDVTLEQEARFRGLYLIGKTGSGKTTLLVNMILQDIEQGMGVCLIEPHGDSIVEIIKRLPDRREKDVILLDPLDDYAFGLNLYHCDNPFDDKQVSCKFASSNLNIYSLRGVKMRNKSPHLSIFCHIS